MAINQSKGLRTIGRLARRPILLSLGTFEYLLKIKKRLSARGALSAVRVTARGGPGAAKPKKVTATSD